MQSCSAALFVTVHAACQCLPPAGFCAVQELQVEIADWHQIKRIRPTGHMRRAVMPDHSVDKVLQGTPVSNQYHHIPLTNKLTAEAHAGCALLVNSQAVHKVSKVSKAKGQTSGRTYTSKYRGVHQTFPTKRWEAQFRYDCLACLLSLPDANWVTINLAAFPHHSSLQTV